MTKIDELKRLSPQKRAACLEKLFLKNKTFFSKKYPDVGKLLRHGGAAPFHIHVTDDFLTITNTETDELCHPEVGLDRFAEALGDWTNSAWIDLIDGDVRNHADYGQYSQFLTRFQGVMLDRFPGLVSRLKNRTINLPTLANGKRFSNSVIFAGIFHGLHIDYYLSRTQLNNAAFFEPDTSRFVLSCYFLDYQALEERFGSLLLHVGEDLPVHFTEVFFNKAQSTGAIWVRVLPGYASDKVEPLMREFRLRWRRMRDAWFPPDLQLNALHHASENVKSGSLILAELAELSSGSRIAIVGSGPSLSNDLDWLKKNQDQVVIFAAYTAVSALQQAGIDPDFQINVEVRHWDQERFDRFQLDPSIPIVTMVGDVPNKFNAFKEVLRLPESGGIHPVEFKRTIPCLSPSTGNTALGFACGCKPEQIYLFGLDFGYRQASKTHVAESSAYKDEATHRLALGSGHLPVAANFSDVDDVYSQPYYNLARLYAQMAIAAVAGQVKVFNCSDGARISGAEPCHAHDIERRPYDKSIDVKLIRSMFVPLDENIHWQPLPLSGETQLEEYKKAMVRELKMAKFNWLKFTKKIDNFRTSVEKKLSKEIAQQRDQRIDPYFEVVNELLVAWYRFLCFTNSEQEWRQVYDEGYAQLSALINEMAWPEAL